MCVCVCVCVGLSSAEAFPLGTDSQRQFVCSTPCRNKSFIPEISMEHHSTFDVVEVKDFHIE